MVYAARCAHEASTERRPTFSYTERSDASIVNLMIHTALCKVLPQNTRHVYTLLKWYCPGTGKRLIDLYASFYASFNASFAQCVFQCVFLMRLFPVPGQYRQTLELFMFVMPQDIKIISKNDLEPRAAIFPKYEPVASHGDSFQASFFKKTTPIFSLRNPNRQA